ncbi:MAG TPA: flagellar protein [Firmicutes bacterium]|jgi:flagellar operon protein|nr:flagellar protein [Bacillota bacterium]
MSERIIPPPVAPAGRVTSGVAPKQRTRAPETGLEFQKILQEKMAPALKFSAHAQQRMLHRGITLSQAELDGVQEAVRRARGKGCRDALVVLDRAALVVSVENQTVVTAVDAQNMRENVFTNIDSAVFVRNSKN